MSVFSFLLFFLPFPLFFFFFLSIAFHDKKNYFSQTLLPLGLTLTLTILSLFLLRGPRRLSLSARKSNTKKKNDAAHSPTNRQPSLPPFPISLPGARAYKTHVI